MNELILKAKSRVMPNSELVEPTHSVDMDKLYGSDNGSDITNIQVYQNNTSVLSTFLAESANSGLNRTFYVRRAIPGTPNEYEWFLLYYDNGWYLGDDRFVSQCSVLNGTGKNFFLNGKSISTLRFIPATNARVIRGLEALVGNLTEDVYLTSTTPAVATPSNPTKPTDTAHSKKPAGILGSLFGSAPAVYKRTLTNGIPNDCSEWAVELAALGMGMGKIRFQYETDMTDQVDITGAFTHAPDSEKIYWQSVDMIDFASLDKDSIYIVRTGLNHSAGHWQVLFYEDKPQFPMGWGFIDANGRVARLTDSNSELTVSAFKSLSCEARDNWGPKAGQRSIALFNATPQNIINATHFLQAYRTTKGDEFTKNLAAQEAVANSRTQLHSSVIVAKQPNEKNADRFTKDNGNFDLNPYNAQTGKIKLGAGIRKQLVDLQVNRLNLPNGPEVKEEDKVKRIKPVIRLIEGKNRQHGIPDDQKADVLNHSFNLFRNNPQAPAVNQYTSWLAITSEEIKLFGNERRTFDEPPIFMTVTTGTGPLYYDKAPYFQDLELILTAWLEEQEKAGVNTLVIPYFWNRDCADVFVNNIIVKFLETSENLKKVYTAIPGILGRSPVIYRMEKNAPAVVDHDLLNVEACKTADVLEIIPHLHAKKAHDEKIGLLNVAPHDGVDGIGYDCAIKKNNQSHLAYSQAETNRDDLRSRIADFSSLLMHQTMDFNTLYMNDAIRALGYDPVHVPDPPIVPKTPAPKRHLNVENARAREQEQRRMQQEAMDHYAAQKQQQPVKQKQQELLDWFIMPIIHLKLEHPEKISQFDRQALDFYRRKHMKDIKPDIITWLNQSNGSSPPEGIQDFLKTAQNGAIKLSDAAAIRNAENQIQASGTKQSMMFSRQNRQDVCHVKGPSTDLEKLKNDYNAALEANPITIKGRTYVFIANIVDGRLQLDQKRDLATNETTPFGNIKERFAAEQKAKGKGPEEQHLGSVLMKTIASWIQGKDKVRIATAVAQTEGLRTRFERK